MIDLNQNHQLNKIKNNYTNGQDLSTYKLSNRIDNSSNNFMSIFKLTFLTVFWVVVLAMVFALGKDVFNKLHIEREQKILEVEICVNEYKSKLICSFTKLIKKEIIVLIQFQL